MSFSVPARSHAVFLFEHSVEVGKVEESAVLRNGEYTLVIGGEKSCGDIQPEVVQV